MRKLLIFIAVLLPFVAVSQTKTITGNLTVTKNINCNDTLVVGSDSVTSLVNLDTDIIPRVMAKSVSVYDASEADSAYWTDDGDTSSLRSINPYLIDAPNFEVKNILWTGKYYSNNLDENFVFGKNAGENLSFGNQKNVFIGTQAGQDVITPSDANFGLGANALRRLTTGNNNIAIGNSAGILNYNGSQNVFIGGDITLLTSDPTATPLNNICIGHGSSKKLQDCGQNVVIGVFSGQEITTGSNNLILGYMACQSGLTTGSSNIVIGYQAAQSAITTESNLLWIENSSAATPLLYGEFDNDLFRVNGEFQINDATSSDYARFYTDTDSLYFITDNNILIECNNFDVKDHIYTYRLFGTQIGYRAGESLTTGVNNSLFGFLAGGGVTEGENNTYIGREAGRFADTYDFNVHVGAFAGRGNSGSSNVSIGYNALNQANTDKTVAIGQATAFANNSHNNGVYIGYESGYNAAGSNNVFIGYQSGYNETNANRLYIENSISSTPLIYGEFDTDYLEINGTFGVNNLVTASSCEAVADDGTLDLEDATPGKVEIWISDGTQDEYILARVYSDGTVTLITTNGNTANADTDGNLCLYQNSTNARIKNRLGAEYTVCYEFKYSE